MNIENLKKIFGQVSEFWKARSKRHKALIIGAACLVLAALTLMTFLINHVSYTLLYSGLSQSEAADVYSQVEAMNVPVKIEGTSTIYVDSQQADEVRMKLAEAGYPQTALSYDIFEKSDDWATTDSARDTYKLYQLQDRLQSTVETINGVKSAIVTIATGNTDNYVLSTDKTTVTASVKLTLAPGANLTTQQVNGIALLVAKSVPNLKTGNVTVLNSDGTVLNGNGANGTASSRLALQKQVEASIKSKILSVLEPIFGTGNIQAAATATMDFSTATINKTTYGSSSNAGTPQTAAGTVQGGNTASGAAGVAGLSGVPTYATSGTTSAGASGTVTSWNTTYLVDTINEQYKNSGGRVTSVSVAVVLNNASSAAATSNVTGLKQTVAYALGISPQNVSIQLAPFAAAQSGVTVNTTASSLSSQVLIGIGIGLAVFLIFVALLTVMLTSRNRKIASARLAAELEAAKASVSAQQLSPPGLDAEIPESSMEDILASKQSAARHQVEDFTDKKPEMVAQILRNWLKDA